MLRTSPSSTSYVLPSSRCCPRRAASACEPAVEQLVPADHLATDEASRDVGVDRPGRVERRLPAAQRPGPRLLLAGREERDQVERVGQPSHDLVERRRPVPERGRLLVGQLGQLRLELEVDPARPVDDLDQSASSSAARAPRGRLARVVAQRAAAVEVREHRPQVVDLLPQRRVARLRLLLDPLEPPLDVVAVGDEQLELRASRGRPPGPRRRRSRPRRRAARRPGGGSRAAAAPSRARRRPGSRRA